MPEVKTTYNYDKFKLITGNRTLNESHVRKLQESLKTSQRLSSVLPIIVNKRNEIVDGQHRYEACKREGEPIHYVVVDGLTLHDVQQLNTTSRSWNMLDYVKSYSELNNINYKNLLNAFIAERTKYPNISISTVATLHGDSSPSVIRSGTYIFEQNKKIAGIWRDYMNCLTEKQRFFQGPKIIKLIKVVSSHKNYNHKRMMKNMTTMGYKVIPTGQLTLQSEMLNILLKVYNHGHTNRETFDD